MATLLVLLLALPAAGLLVLYALPARQAARVGAGTGTLVFLLSLVLLPLFDYSHAEQMQGQLNVPWVPAFDLRFHLGIDGISLPLLLLTTLLSALCLLYAVRTTAKDESGRAFTALLLVLEIGMVGTFVAQDLLLFFIFFEIVLIPMYGLIHHWGSGEERRREQVHPLHPARLGADAARVPADPRQGRHLRHGRPGPAARPRDDPRRAGGRVPAGRPRLRGQDPDVAAAHLAARRAHLRADRRLGAAGRGAAENGHLRLHPDRRRHGAARRAP